MTVKESLKKALSKKQLNRKTYFAFVDSTLFGGFLDLTPKEFFDIFDYYDVLFTVGIGKIGFCQLQDIFPQLQKTFNVSNTRKVEAFSE